MILQKKEFYNLTDIYNRMIKHYIINLIANINNNGKLNKLIQIRINQFQIQEQLTNNPLKNQFYYDIKPFKENLIAQILSTINNQGLNIRWNSDNNFKIERDIPLHYIFLGMYWKYKDKLRAKSILFLDQLQIRNHLLKQK